MGVGRRWRPYRDIRDRPDVDIVLTRMPDGWPPALLADAGDVKVILVNRNADPAERLVHVAHEVVHLERGGSGHRPGLTAQQEVLVAREEQRVDRIVAERLLPHGELVAWVEATTTVEPVTVWACAEHFGVTLPVAARALLDLQDRGRLKSAK